jgi:hypothetical protein
MYPSVPSFQPVLLSAEPETLRACDGSQSWWLAPASVPTVDVGCVPESTQTWGLRLGFRSQGQLWPLKPVAGLPDQSLEPLEGPGRSQGAWEVP